MQNYPACKELNVLAIDVLILSLGIRGRLQSLIVGLTELVMFWQKNVHKYWLTTWRTNPAQEKCGWVN